MVSLNNKYLKNIWPKYQKQILVLVGALVLAGVVYSARAAGPLVSFEAESGSRSGNVLIKSDSAASGGSYAEFSAGTPPPPTGGCTGTAINPGDSWQSKSNAGSEGTTFCIKAGVHRMQTVNAKSNQKFIGEAGAVMSGAKVLTGWTQSGSNWYVGGQTQGSSASGLPCRDGEPRCGHPEDLFVDNKRLTHVASLGDLGAGKWYFDYGADRIYIRDNPSGKTVETSVLPVALNGGPSGVHVKNLVIEKYATPNQNAAVGGTGGTQNWLIENNEIRYNHAVGVRGSTGAVVRGNDIHHNGMLGAAGGANHLYENNKSHHNALAGWGGFTGGYSGGSKWTHANGLIVRGNHHYDNNFTGLWADGNNINVTIENNLVENSQQHGIFYEIGHKAIIRNNISRNNGWGGGYWADRAGILMNTSQDVEIYGNTVENNYNGIAVIGRDRSASNTTYGPYVNRNNKIYNNTITMTNGYTGSLGTNTEWNTIKFYNNTYKLKGGSGYFRFNNIPQSSIYNWDQWRNLGQDTGSSYTTF